MNIYECVSGLKKKYEHMNISWVVVSVNDTYESKLKGKNNNKNQKIIHPRHSVHDVTNHLFFSAQLL